VGINARLLDENIANRMGGVERCYKVIEKAVAHFKLVQPHKGNPKIGLVRGQVHQRGRRGFRHRMSRTPTGRCRRKPVI
jgi:hypothetical protein